MTWQRTVATVAWLSHKLPLLHHINILYCFPAGFPVNYLDEYPILKDYRNHIASIDFVKERYAAAEGHAAAFKADA